MLGRASHNRGLMFRAGFVCAAVPCHHTALLDRSIDRQAESVALEGRIRSVKGVKAETLEQILEAERQGMLWEKKMQLERETQVP